MAKDVEKITFLRCQKILPLVYDESLSYYEAICKFQSKLNEVIDALEGISLEVLNEAKAYTDEKIAEQQSRIDTVVAELTELVNQTRTELNQLIADTKVDFDAKINELQTQYSRFVSQVNAILTIYNNRLEDLADELHASIIGVNARTDLAIQQNNDYIFSVIQNQLPTELKVVNFFTGQKISIQDMFNYLANLHVDNGIDYATLASRANTFNQLVGYRMNYTQLVMNGNSIIQ